MQFGINLKAVVFGRIKTVERQIHYKHNLRLIGDNGKMPKGKTAKTVVQNHHISYTPEVVVRLYRGEHWILTQMQRRKKVSRGFITSLKVYVAEHEYVAKNLTKK